MKMDNEIISAEEFFGEIDKNSSPRCCQNGKSAADGLFAKMKVKMVMRIYGVSRAKALEIIAGRNSEHKANRAANDSSSLNGDDGFMTAEEFFGV